MEYTFGTTIPGTIADATETVTAALTAEGFGILSTIDVAATLKAKLDVDHDGYIILGACNAGLANLAVGADPDVGALLPCNVVLRQEGDAVAVRVIDPAVMLGLVDAVGVHEAGAEARTKLLRVVEALAS
ncbi:MAG: DUF302 domain-containing protein [Acidimicrobiia bacterium]